MRHLLNPSAVLLLALALPLRAQEAQEKKEPVPEAAAAPAAEIAPAETSWKLSLEAGYRWNQGVQGNFNIYRSVVNLGEGPRVTSLDLTYQGKPNGWLDQMNIRATGWGGDPYNWAHFDAVREKLYRLNIDYRNIAYFNNLPSFANPQLTNGIFYSQRAMDIHRRMAETELELRPGTRVIPYLAWSHNSGFGTGITDYIATQNEYPVSNSLRDKTDLFRGGVHIEMNRWHVTLEEGGTLFKDDQRVFTNDRNLGNRATPYFGQSLFVTNLNEAYGVRGSSLYSKALLTASPFSWLDVNAQFLFSEPKTDTNFNLAALGKFATAVPGVVVDVQNSIIAAQASQPHTTATAGFEMRPLNRVRILESFTTDRFHDASALLLAGTVDRLEVNYNRQEFDVLVDLTGRVTVRGGHRYTWGDGRTAAPLLSATGGFETGELRNNAALAGLNFRVTQKFTFNVDAEVQRGNRAWFRTSLLNYEKVRGRAQYQLTSFLNLGATFGVLQNEYPKGATNGNFNMDSHTFFMSVLVTPKGGNRFRLFGEYGRSTFFSQLGYILPTDFTQQLSRYQDNGHAATALLDFVPVKTAKFSPRISVGGSLFTSNGSRPTNFYQPLARVIIPINKHLEWNADWRWYGMSEAFYQYEGFRGHQGLVGFRVF